MSDPKFYQYLCAVADWRLKKPRSKSWSRVGILTWKEFLEKFKGYYDLEPPERKALIEGNCDYYSSGGLPDCLPVLPDGLPPSVVSESMSGQRIVPRKPRK